MVSDETTASPLLRIKPGIMDVLMVNWLARLPHRGDKGEEETSMGMPPQYPPGYYQYPPPRRDSNTGKTIAIIVAAVSVVVLGCCCTWMFAGGLLTAVAGIIGSLPTPTPTP